HKTISCGTMMANCTSSVPWRDGRKSLPPFFLVRMTHLRENIAFRPPHTTHSSPLPLIHAGHHLQNLNSRRTRQDNKDGGEDAEQGREHDLDRRFRSEERRVGEEGAV